MHTVRKLSSRRRTYSEGNIVNLLDRILVFGALLFWLFWFELQKLTSYGLSIKIFRKPQKCKNWPVCLGDGCTRRVPNIAICDLYSDLQAKVEFLILPNWKSPATHSQTRRWYLNFLSPCTCSDSILFSLTRQAQKAIVRDMGLIVAQVVMVFVKSILLLPFQGM